MIDDLAKAYLHSDLRDARETIVWKLDGLDSSGRCGRTPWPAPARR